MLLSSSLFPASASVSTAAVPLALGTGMGTSTPPPQHATAVRPPWFPEPESVPSPPPSLTGRVPPPPPSLTEEIRRVVLAMREEEEANARLLDTVSEEEEIEAALEWHRTRSKSPEQSAADGYCRTCQDRSTTSGCCCRSDDHRSF
eukprot:6005708-Pleurochrysis_carterae.AAC.1